ncbi:uncharacterized protein [Dermacentor albipictus]|uniref:uncharacterized protein n=1 Tax=Dermacentor albipictus TaxID=60249 RepID=UPI0038FC07AD
MTAPVLNATSSVNMNGGRAPRLPSVGGCLFDGDSRCTCFIIDASANADNVSCLKASACQLQAHLDTPPLLVTAGVFPLGGPLRDYGAVDICCTSRTQRTASVMRYFTTDRSQADVAADR